MATQAVATQAAASVPTTATVAVRELAAFVHRGDLHYRYDRATTAVEGIDAQRRAQRDRPEGYRREVSVEATLHGHGVALTVRGRIDGIDAEAGLVEEFKTTRTDMERLHAHLGHLHMAQLKLYAALVGGERKAWRLRLVYVRPDHEASLEVEETLTREALTDFLEATVEGYTRWLSGCSRRAARRDAVLGALAFPFEDFRDHQRQMARGGFRAFRDAEQLLVEAPTGSGKTVAMLYAALRAMGDGRLDRAVFLTARGTGQRAAADALARCVPGDQVAAVTVTAKDKICFHPGTPCDPEHCEHARGYYDRMPAARDALLRTGLVARERVEATAREHRVCPFELSLDAAAWADVVICDYNYVFDPVVRLRRLVTSGFGRVGLLVDEAHQLGGRAGEMLSVSLARAACRRALADAPSGLAARLRSVDRALLALRRTEDDGPIAPPAALLRSLERLLAAAADVDLAPAPDTRAFLGDGHRFVAGAGWFDATDYRYLLATAGRDVEVRMACLSPAGHVASVLGEFHGAVRFSGTLSPPKLFQTLHGQSEGARSGRVDAGFPDDALGVFAVPDVSTYYRDRARTLDALAGLVRTVTEAAPGNYLVALPSFAYLDAVTEALRAVSSLRVRAQRPDMADEERARFVAELSDPGAPCIGAVVMGGLFAESVDFDGGALRGVVVVGPGLPPRSTERDLVAERHGNNGFTVAYLQPAMAKVVQAAGRAVRGPRDRGVVVLVDPRFAESRCQAFFPAHWRPRRVRAAAIGDAVAAFWNDRREAASPASNRGRDVVRGGAVVP